METESLETIIRRYVNLKKPNSNGWHPCLHFACDTGHKGDRAAFLFGENESVVFHCFNCGLKAGYNPVEHKMISSKMGKVLRDFNIPQDIWETVNFRALTLYHGDIPTEKPVVINYEPVVLTLPTYFYSLPAESDDVIALEAVDYLNSRGIDPKSQQFFLSRNTPISKKWYGRLIIPVYKDGNLIFYQGRDLTGSSPRKYLSVETPRENVLAGFEHIHNNSKLPLYICEGWFDAKVIDGVAVLGRTISKGQLYWLSQTRRPKVVIPDRSGAGSSDLARQALKLGWAVSLPDCPNCKDINEAVTKYGLLYVLKSLRENTKTGFEAEVMINLNVEK